MLALVTGPQELVWHVVSLSCTRVWTAALWLGQGARACSVLLDQPAWACGLGVLSHWVGLRCVAGEGPKVRQEVHGVGGHLIGAWICDPHREAAGSWWAACPGKGMCEGTRVAQHCRNSGLNHAEAGAPGYRTTERACEIRGTPEAPHSPALGRCPLP